MEELNYSILFHWEEWINLEPQSKKIAQFEKEISHIGYIKYSGCVIYNPMLAILLSSKEVPYEDSVNKVNSTFNGTDFYSIYKSAFADGLYYFNNEIAMPMKDLYVTDNVKQFIEDLRMRYLGDPDKSEPGWKSFKNEVPLILNKKVLTKLGFNCGIVKGFEEYRIKHKPIFDKYFVPEGTLIEKQSLSEAEEKPKVKGLILAKETASKLLEVDQEFEFTKFSDLLNDENGRLLPALTKLYKGKKPMEYALMLYALHDLGLLRFVPHAFTNMTELQNLIMAQFECMGTRQSLARNLRLLLNPSKLMEIKISSHKNRILERLR